MKLFRGIALSENNVKKVIENFKKTGISISENATWKFKFKKNTANFIEELLMNTNFSIKETRKNENESDYSVCFADEIGAKFYSLKHNKTEEKNISILLEVEVNIEDVIIDGRDFLYTCFQFLEMNDKQKQERQIKELEKIYGTKIKEYLIKSSLTEDQTHKIALCDLATQDNDIIKQHYLNETIIGGRHNTIFRSAFHVKTPIKSENIISVKIINETFNIQPELTLKIFMER